MLDFVVVECVKIDTKVIRRPDRSVPIWNAPLVESRFGVLIERRIVVGSGKRVDCSRIDARRGRRSEERRELGQYLRVLSCILYRSVHSEQFCDRTLLDGSDLSTGYGLPGTLG